MIDYNACVLSTIGIHMVKLMSPKMPQINMYWDQQIGFQSNSVFV